MAGIVLLTLWVTNLAIAQAVCDIDGDQDGYVSQADCPENGTDCDDADPDAHPFATEIENNGIDEDCNGEDLVTLCDADSDGFDALACGGSDCDDGSAEVFPGAEEIDGDLIDQDCDGYDYCQAVEWVQGGLECASASHRGGAVLAALGLALALRRRALT